MLTVHIIPRNTKPHFAPTYDVCAAGYSSVYNFPTRKAAKEFCDAMGFDVYGARDSERWRATIQEVHIA